MRFLVFAANVVAWPLNWLLDRADRDVCAWVHATDEDTA